jgi:hypothetical protein
MGMQFLFGTSSFTAAHDDDLNKKSGARQWSWAPGSTIRRVVCDDDPIGFEFPRSFKNPATTDPIDGPTRSPIRTSSTTTRSSVLALTEIQTIKLSLRSKQWSLKNKQSRSDQFHQQVFNYQQIYDNKIRLLFIKPYSTSAETSAQSDHRGEPVGQIGAHTPELVCVEWSTSNMPPHQKKLIQAQSAGHG